MNDSTTPILSFRFSVEISGYPGEDTNWQSVKGISKSLDTTVIHSVRTIEKLKKEDNELNNNIDNLKSKILYNKENEI